MARKRRRSYRGFAALPPLTRAQRALFTQDPAAYARMIEERARMREQEETIAQMRSKHLRRAETKQAKAEKYFNDPAYLAWEARREAARQGVQPAPFVAPLFNRPEYASQFTRRSQRQRDERTRAMNLRRYSPSRESQPLPDTFAQESRRLARGSYQKAHEYLNKMERVAAADSVDCRELFKRWFQHKRARGIGDGYSNPTQTMGWELPGEANALDKRAANAAPYLEACTLQIARPSWVDQSAAAQAVRNIQAKYGRALPAQRGGASEEAEAAKQRAALEFAKLFPFSKG